MDTILRTPFDERAIRDLRAGDTVYITGSVFTARDEAHQILLQAAHSGEEIPFHPEEMAMFHCGPIVQKEASGWNVVSAGPTTSIRMEMFEAEFLRTYSTRLIIGKGGMGARTLEALSDVGAVYTHFTGGAGALAARAIHRITGVHWLEKLGMPEAVWLLEVEKFGPLLVTMDSHGNDLYKDLAVLIDDNMKKIYARIEEEA